MKIFLNYHLLASKEIPFLLTVTYSTYIFKITHRDTFHMSCTPVALDPANYPQSGNDTGNFGASCHYYHLNTARGHSICHAWVPTIRPWLYRTVSELNQISCFQLIDCFHHFLELWEALLHFLYLLYASYCFIVSPRKKPWNLAGFGFFFSYFQITVKQLTSRRNHFLSFILSTNCAYISK